MGIDGEELIVIIRVCFSLMFFILYDDVFDFCVWMWLCKRKLNDMYWYWVKKIYSDYLGLVMIKICIVIFIIENKVYL